MSDFDKAIKAAKNLVSDGENPEYDRALAELIIDTSSPSDVENWAEWDGDDKKDYVLALISNKIDGSKNTLRALSSSIEFNEITISPTGLDDPNTQWALYIPPTREDMFDGYDPEILQPEDEEPWTYQAAVLSPWGTSYWHSLQAAIAFLSVVQKQGNVKYNDGRSAT